MNAPFWLFARIVLLLVFTLPASAQEPAKKPPTISVAATESQGMSEWRIAIGTGLGQMITTELAALPNFKVLESVALDDLRAERALGEAGEVAASEAVKRGQWKGADYTFKSVVTRFGSKENGFGANPGSFIASKIPIPIIGSFSVKKREQEVQIDWRIIDNASREVVQSATGRGVGKETGTGFNFEAMGGSGFSSDKEWQSSALGKATMKAIAQIVEKVKTLDLGPGARTLNAEKPPAPPPPAPRNLKGVVKMVEGKEIWVSLGAAGGFAKGDKIKILKSVEKKNKKGELVATTYEVAAEITLLRVQKDKSMGEYTGTAQIAEDWVAVDASVDVEKLE